MDALITIVELHTAVKLTNRGRSPGIDGIPGELCLEPWDILAPIWLDTVNSAIRRCPFHKALNTALNSVLHKPGRDPKNCTSHRPIMLINADIKIYSLMVAMCLEEVVGEWINPAQAGFL